MCAAGSSGNKKNLAQLRHQIAHLIEFSSVDPFVHHLLLSDTDRGTVVRSLIITIRYNPVCYGKQKESSS